MNDIEKILLGALIAIFGGVIGKVFTVYYDERKERKFIKSNLKDELQKIISIIEKLIETNEKTNQIHPTYLTDITANTECYKYHRIRLYLISDTDTKKKYYDFLWRPSKICK